MSISIKQAKSYCCEDISLIENYEEAVNDSEMWECHHRLGIELNKSKKELKEMGLYYNRPACELIFLTHKEHDRLHGAWNKGKKGLQTAWNKGKKGLQTAWNKGKTWSEETKQKNREKHLGKTAWNKGVPASEESKQKNREKHLGKTPGNKGKKTPHKKYLWRTPDGEEKIMNKRNAEYYHPDWTLIGEIKKETQN